MQKFLEEYLWNDMSNWNVFVDLLQMKRFISQIPVQSLKATFQKPIVIGIIFTLIT